MTIGENIRRLRKESGLTQRQLAKAVGVNEVTLRGYEAGKYKPKMVTIWNLMHALNCSFNDIVDAENFNELFQGSIQTTAETLNFMAKDSNQAMAESIKDVAGAIAAMAKDEEELLSDYHNLNNYGKKEARKRVNELTEIPKYQKKDD